LYSKQELREILAARGMELVSAYASCDGEPDTDQALQLMVYSRKG